MSGRQTNKHQVIDDLMNRVGAALLAVAAITAAFNILTSRDGLAQDRSYRVVFDLTSNDSLDQRAVVRWIREIRSSNSHAQIEVVMYGKGFELVMPERSRVIDEVKRALDNPDVSFAVCEVALRNNNVEKHQLLPNVKTVPDGIFEIITKQKDGWGYIKVSH